MSEAVGLIEVYGLVTAFVAADAACKAANVTIEAFDRNKPANAEKMAVPLIIMVKIRGSVSDVRAGVAAAVEAANGCAGVVTSHVIARPEEGTKKMLKINALGSSSF